MPGSFFGLDTALRGLTADQVALDTINHNITNANTTGYSRQSVNLQASTPIPVPTMNRDPSAGQLGTGVDITSISRASDPFTNQQLRYESSLQSAASSHQGILTQMESIFNEPSTTGINSQMSQFWNSWQALSNNPADMGARSNVRQQGQTLAGTVQQVYSQLSQLQGSLDQQVGTLTTQVNQISAQISNLNSQIASVQGSGNQPNDLRDQRGTLLDQLSNLTSISYVEQPNGMVNVSMANGPALVQGNTATTLTTATNASNGGFLSVYGPDGSALSITSGQLGATLSARDGDVASRITALNQFASDLIGSVNALHAAGSGLPAPGTNPPGPSGNAFFSGTGASDIGLSAAITDPTNGLSNIAAGSSASGIYSDRSNATTIANLANTPLSQVQGMNSTSTASLSGEYEGIIAQLGTDANHSQSTLDAQNGLVQQLKNQKSSISSVSLDQEATDLIRYQRAFQASARVISTIDQMLSTLIDNMT